MAERRMLSKKIFQSRKFLMMPFEAQALYTHLILSSDDDGIVEAFPIVRMIGAKEDSLGLLVVKKFILPLNEDMVYFITDFEEQNKIRADRVQPSRYRDLLLEKTDMVISGKRVTNSKNIIDGQMTDNCLTSDGQMTDNCLTHVNQVSAQYSIGKDSIGEYRIGKNNKVDEVDDVELSIPNKKKPLSQILKESAIKINDRQSQILIEYIGLDCMTVDMIQYAIELTEDAGANNFNYLNKILKSWKEKGFTSLEEAQADNRDHKQGNKSSATGNIPDWSSAHPKNQKKEEERILTKEEFLALDEYD
ncbi:DnaD domain protein [Streptococcus koreensis]|uniref:DnaD domain-containing protein n=1 Tax=Streptococcus koreensis TaxID=2382163 RepID=UPI003CEF5DBC